jgi:hypothetical protein
MLTRAKHKQGEGTLKTFNPEVGHASRRKKMAEEDKHDEQEKKFHMVFYRMSEMVERMYGDYEKRMKKKGKKKEAHADDDASVNKGLEEILLSLHLRLQVLVLLPLSILITLIILTIKPLLRNHY